MSNFVEQVRKLNERYGKILSIEKLIECKNSGELNIDKPEKNTIDEVVMVHVTDYEPTDNRIKTSKEKGIIKDLNGIPLYDMRNTTHCTVNGVVTSHEGGNWDKRKYAIIIPGKTFLKENGKKCLSGSVEDLYIDGGIDLKDAIIVCPKSDCERISRENPDNIIICFDGDLAVDVKNKINYPETVLDLMEIDRHKIAEFGFDVFGEKGAELIHHYIDIIIKENYSLNNVESLFQSRHSESIQIVEEDILNYAQTFNTRLNQLSNDELIKYIEICKEVPSDLALEENKDKDAFFRSMAKYNYGLHGHLIKLINKEKNIKKNTKNVERIKSSVKMIDEALLDMGISSLQGEEKNSYGHYFEIRAAESKIIDNYLGVSIKEIYDGDMITTNAKRIKMIHEKMKEEGEENNPAAKEAFEACVKHFVRDYKTLSQCYDKRIDMEGFDFEKYNENLKDTFVDLGLDRKDIISMREEDLLMQVNIETELKDYLKQQGYMDEPADSISQRSVNRLKFVYDVMYKSAIEDYKSGNLDTDDWGTIPNGEKFGKSYAIRRLIEKELSKKLGEMENPQELTSQLEEMGFYVNKNGKIESENKIDELLNMAEKQAKQEQQAEEKKGDEATADTGDLDNLKQSYSESGIEPANLQNARNQMENTISQDKGQNQSTKEGEENDEH